MFIARRAIAAPSRPAAAAMLHASSLPAPLRMGLTNFPCRLFAFKPSPALVKELRNMTGSPLKDCMAVLAETEGDLEASKDLLRKKGLAFAEKRADRDATEGLIGIAQSEDTFTMVQFACETDFVAKTDRFRAALGSILKTVHGQDGLAVGMAQTRDPTVIEGLTAVQLADSLDPDVAAQSMEDGIKFTISKTQENCQLARVYKTKYSTAQGEVLETYLHNKVLPGVGKIGTVFVSRPPAE